PARAPARGADRGVEGRDGFRDRRRRRLRGLLVGQSARRHHAGKGGHTRRARHHERVRSDRERDGAPVGPRRFPLHHDAAPARQPRARGPGRARRRPGRPGRDAAPPRAGRLSSAADGIAVAQPASSGVSAQIEYCYARGWTDGLPVIPATRPLVDAMLAAARLDGGTVLAEMPSRNARLTAEHVAINAVMAGCRPEYMPVVAAAVKALATPEFALHHVASGLSGSTIVVLVNGPIAKRLGINATNNVFGPGPRANATIGRTLRLLLLNCLCYTPGVSDRATMGTPGKYTCCIAENEENHPWEPWHVERGFNPEDSTVTLVAASSMLQVWNYGNHEQLLRCVADALSFLGSIAILDRSPGAVVFSGEHAELLRASGWSKARIREFVVEHTGRRIADLKRAGRIDGEVTAADETSLHYAMDTP